MNINWNTILPLLQLVFSAVEPQIKQFALDALKAEDAKVTNPIVKLLVEEAEKLVAAA